MSNKVTEKIQVLISSDDMSYLNRLILIDAISSNKPPVPVSSYVRNIIKKHINDNKYKYHQKSFVEKTIEKIKNKK